MRIDKFLFFVRLAKSRSIAQALVEQGNVRVDGHRIAKSSEPVRAGSIVVLALHGSVRVIEVLALPERRGPAGEARSCYREIDEAGAPS